MLIALVGKVIICEYYHIYLLPTTGVERSKKRKVKRFVIQL